MTRRIERGFYFVMRLCFVGLFGICVYGAVVAHHWWAQVLLIIIACGCAIGWGEARP